MSKKISLISIFLILIIGSFLLVFKNGTMKIVEAPATSDSFTLPVNDNIVFIVVDTLRADHLPFYGYDINTAPFLNEIAKKSVVFENAFSASSTTAPAMASIFTSTYPTQHGVLMGMQATKRFERDFKALSINKIPQDLLKLGELMKQSGFKTYGVADNLNIDEPIGYISGFDKFNTFQYEGAPKINKIAFDYFNEIKDSKHFLYLHYMDPHIPYHRRDPWFNVNEPNTKLAAYDSEIRYTDEHIKEVFEKYQILKNSLVVFVSDHGEELGDHGDYGHGRNLYPEVIHVPLFIYHRDLPPARVKQPVHTIDILPTLAELLSFKALPHWEGESLTRYFSDHNFTKKRTTFSQLLGPKEYVREKFLAAIDQEEWLYIDSLSQDRKELFKLSEDPQAMNDLLLLYPQKSTSLASEINEILDKKIMTEFEEVDIEMNEKTIDKLKTLGYF